MKITEENYNDIKFETAHEDCLDCRSFLDLAEANFRRLDFTEALTGGNTSETTICYGKVYILGF